MPMSLAADNVPLNLGGGEGLGIRLQDSLGMVWLTT